ncbi:MAG: glycosyltransferase [Actinomycetota bacterium]|nr:glycosyltransferase [Candidatus Dormibacteraeota bacterium]MDQ6915015.1 glycosyltransferase [Actinomycetota bacterium]
MTLAATFATTPARLLRPSLVVAGLAPTVDVVVPVYNEERALSASVRRLREYLTAEFPFPALITIADNASSDATLAVAHMLAEELPGIRVVHLDQKGRGRALAAAWLTSDAEIVAYMDVDLSTDLAALLPLVAPLLSGHSSVAIGSRLARGARVVRGPKRELISRSYNLLLRLLLRVGFRDAQCGFKAVRRDVAAVLIPAIKDRNWFFDTEFLVLAERAGLRVHEVPVDWVDDPDSRVDIVATAVEDLRGIWRLLRRRGPDESRLIRQGARFGLVGLASTAAYAGIFWSLRGLLPAATANLIALAITAIANTAANRRLTFGVRGSKRLLRDHLSGLLALAVALAVTSLSILSLQALLPSASRLVEIATLTAANAFATVVRFVLLRSFLFHARGSPHTSRGLGARPH